MNESEMITTTGYTALRDFNLADAMRDLGHTVRDVGNVAPSPSRPLIHPNRAIHHLPEITGWIDASHPGFDPHGRDLRVEGRDKGASFTPEGKNAILAKLIEAEQFEKFCARK